MLTPDEVAQRLGVSGSTVRKWIKSGQMRGTRVGRKLLRVQEAEVERWLASHNPPPQPPAADERQLDLTIGLHDDPVIGSMLEPTTPAT